MILLFLQTTCKGSSTLITNLIIRKDVQKTVQGMGVYQFMVFISSYSIRFIPMLDFQLQTCRRGRIASLDEDKWSTSAYLGCQDDFIKDRTFNFCCDIFISDNISTGNSLLIYMIKNNCKL